MNSRIFIYQSLFSLWLVMLSLSTPAHANTFRWVDENGRVHYSDQIPPSETSRAYTILNKEGVTVNNIEKVKTKEELAKENRLKEQQEEQEQIAREKQNHDRILLDTYTKVSDLEETRDRYIATLEGLIKVAQYKLTNLNSSLDKQNKIAANLEREGKVMPDVMRQDISNLQRQIDLQNKFILSQRAQQKEMKDKFAADIKRFKELKAMQQSAN